MSIKVNLIYPYLNIVWYRMLPILKAVSAKIAAPGKSLCSKKIADYTSAAVNQISYLPFCVYIYTYMLQVKYLLHNHLIPRLKSSPCLPIGNPLECRIFNIPPSKPRHNVLSASAAGRASAKKNTRKNRLPTRITWSENWTCNLSWFVDSKLLILTCKIIF